MIYKLIMLSEKQQIWGIWLSAKTLTHSKSMGILDCIKIMLLLKNGFLEKIETWHVGLSCQYTHFMSFSSKSEHDTITDQATLRSLSQKLTFSRKSVSIKAQGAQASLQANLKNRASDIRFYHKHFHF